MYTKIYFNILLLNFNYSKSSEDDLDHAVLVVGYGLMNGELYWLVKNSWSTYWVIISIRDISRYIVDNNLYIILLQGNDGYILMSARDNNCGVLTAPTYVTF